VILKILMNSKSKFKFPKQIRLPTTQSVRDLAKLFDSKVNKTSLYTSKSTPTTPTFPRRSSKTSISLPNSPDKVSQSGMKKITRAAAALGDAVSDVFGATSAIAGAGAAANSISEDWSSEIADEVLLDSLEMGRGKGKADQKRKASKSPSATSNMEDERIDQVKADVESHKLLIAEIQQKLVALTESTQESVAHLTNGLTRTDQQVTERMNQVEEMYSFHEERIGVLEEFKTKMTEESRNFFEEQMRELKKAVLNTNGAALYGMAANNCEQGLYIAGIDNIKKLLKLSGNWDPAMVVGELLLQCDRQIYGSRDRILIPIQKGKQRRDGNTAIIYFRSIQAKKEAAIFLKKKLMSLGARGINIRDLFPAERMEEVNQLTRLGHLMKREKVILKFRVINVNNAPVIQIMESGSKQYKALTPEQVEEGLKKLPAHDEQMDQEYSEEQNSRQFNRMEQQSTSGGRSASGDGGASYNGGESSGSGANGGGPDNQQNGERSGRTEARGRGGCSRTGSSTSRSRAGSSASMRGSRGGAHGGAAKASKAGGAQGGGPDKRANGDSDKPTYGQMLKKVGLAARTGLDGQKNHGGQKSLDSWFTGRSNSK